LSGHSEAKPEFGFASVFGIVSAFISTDVGLIGLLGLWINGDAGETAAIPLRWAGTGFLPSATPRVDFSSCRLNNPFKRFRQDNNPSDGPNSDARCQPSPFERTHACQVASLLDRRKRFNSNRSIGEEDAAVGGSRPPGATAKCARQRPISLPLTT
jgi:hypothetical protein